MRKRIYNTYMSTQEQEGMQEVDQGILNSEDSFLDTGTGLTSLSNQFDWLGQDRNTTEKEILMRT
jgi:hypothetical protein